MSSRRIQILLSLVVMTVFCLATYVPAYAQYFGQNKVQYENFDFKILQTEHFDIHFYPEEKESAVLVGQMMERWYSFFAVMFNHELTGRQPLILYASHPQFEQTNAIPGFLSESVGGVTEALKRRIVLPFGGPLPDTDHVVGHELIHAFQYDLTRQGNSRFTLPGALRIPLWFIEGMSEYFTVGAVDPHTAMWMRDAARHKRLPSFNQLMDPRYFPYRFGHSFLAYIGGTFGDEKLVEMLKEGGAKSFQGAVGKVLAVHPDSLTMAWHKSIREVSDTLLSLTRDPEDYGKLLISKSKGGGELNIAPVVSPNGDKLIFFSEKDLFSINLFLADANTGKIKHSIVRAERDPHLESMQFLNSAGAWGPEGKIVAFSTVTKGRPVLRLLDVKRRKVIRKIRFPSLGEILNPSWSPDGRAIAFTALAGGFTDLFIYDLETDSLKRITEDPFSDLQPSWSPDGKRLAFSTDRFTANLETLDSGHLELAMYNPETGTIAKLNAFSEGKHINPSWSPDGKSLFFVSDREGISNIYRIIVDTGQLFRITNLYTGVSGITATSPVISTASNGYRLVFCAYEDGNYNIYTLDDAEVMSGEPITEEGLALASITAPDSPAWLPPVYRPNSELLDGLMLADKGAKAAPTLQEATVTKYRSRFSLDYIGQPYLVAGVDRFGTAVGGGISMFWSDMLGNHNMATALQFSSNGNFTDIGGYLGYQNTKSRWNWGAILQMIPYTYDRFTAGFAKLDPDDPQEVYYEQLLSSRETVRDVTLFTTFPFSRASRIEFYGGFQNISYDQKISTIAVDMAGNVVLDEEIDLPAPPSLYLGTSSIAYVYDFSIYGATSPILGRRFRLDLSPTYGSLNYYSVLFDYRRYMQPVRPFTLAFRLMHYGRYGQDAESGPLYDLYLGYQSLIRGYDSGSFSSVECLSNDAGPCPVYDQLFGSRMAVGNVELRFPLLGVLGLGSGYYGFLPLETAVFFDSGVAWTKGEDADFLGGNRNIVKSYGFSIRLGISYYAVLNFDLVNPLDRPYKSWYWQFSIIPGF